MELFAGNRVTHVAGFFSGVKTVKSVKWSYFHPFQIVELVEGGKFLGDRLRLVTE